MITAASSIIGEIRTLAVQAWRHPLCDSPAARLGAAWRTVAWYALHGARRAPLVADFACGTQLLTQRRVGGREVFITGLSEFQSMGFIVHFLRPDEIFYDVGANIGAFTVLAAACAGARCVAFEPASPAFEFLSQNVERNGLASQVDVRRLAVASARGDVVMSIGLGPANHILREDEPTGTKARAIRLDDVILETGTPVMVKIDIEGYEEDALRGAQQLLADRHLQAVLIESSGHGSAYGSNEAALRDLIGSFGFTPCRYDPRSRQLATANTRETLLSDKANVIFVRDVQAARSRLLAGKSCTIRRRSF